MGPLLGVDVGGTSVKAGIVIGDGNLYRGGRLIELDARQQAEPLLEELCAGLRRVLDEGAGSGPITGVGIGMPGPFDYERGISLIRGQDKFDSLYGMDVGAQLRRRLELPAEVPVRFINDAVAFALGECLYGAGRGFDRVLAITLGTGFGCALVERSGAVAWEVEAYAMPYRDRRVADYLSRRGILSLWRSKYQSRSSLHAAAEPADVEALAKAAFAGDEACRQLFREWGEMLAEVLASVVTETRPECIVVGGAIAQSLHLFRDPLDRSLSGIGQQPSSPHREPGPEVIPCVVAACDTYAAVKGAAAAVSRGRQLP